MEQGLRFNKGKLEWSLVDFESLKPMVEVLMYGKDKYTTADCSGAHNWKKGEWTNELIESLLRHTFSLLNGELIDAESGKSHIGHLMCNAMFLEWMLKNKPEFDTLNLIKNDNTKDNTIQLRDFAGSSGLLPHQREAFGGLGEEIHTV